MAAAQATHATFLAVASLANQGIAHVTGEHRFAPRRIKAGSCIRCLSPKPHNQSRPATHNHTPKLHDLYLSQRGPGCGLSAAGIPACKGAYRIFYPSFVRIR